ncbi:beta-lactamase family protein [Paenibacillus macerans]|uniref:Beta-lactamase family protein n=1 Tax=Paenibacillus macerans TaxID=44252 RepID=A0A090Z2Z8_PAEMA|nr:serine hydrolase [Paenibacillus macerans]KFN05604.1 beta-lactamase family protein [Paenibacillus macerans]MCY7559791.1 beta-lactamase family protein [Paenibacillus macerans]MEC0154395.1 serine hydrolase [Paenibacillus macerans]MEC0332377.1 serine hydrolase [Paenibacillus macerans]MED4958669.1 serine hydrolase [Paenibacillus macerans]
MNTLGKTLPRKSLEELGISARNVIDFLDEMEAQSIELHSFMLVRHGHVAAEGWWEPYRPELPHMLFSLSKSFTSTAIGMAVQEGLLKLDDPVISFFPDDLPDEISPNLAAMQIRHLLMMGTGHAADTTEALHEAEDGNWVKAFLKQPVEHEPGTFFLYNTGATYMLSAILQQASGQTLLEFLRPRLFEPLGIEHPTWETCPRGIHTGGYGLKITTEDIAKFGQLYLQKGLWYGRRLVEESWIEAAVSKQISNGDGGDSDWAQGYGYQFWRCRHGVYRGDGAFGQFCIVLPERDAVIAMTAGTNDLQGVLNGVWDHLLGAFGPVPAVPDGSSGELERRLRELRLEPPRMECRPDAENRLNGQSYSLEENELGLASFRMDFYEKKASLQLKNKQGEHALELGRGEWGIGRSSLSGPEERVAASFTWRNAETLLLTIRRIETPFALSVEVELFEQGIEIRSEINVSFGETKFAPIRGRLE